MHCQDEPQHADFLALAIPINLDFMDLPDALLEDPYTSNIIESLAVIPGSIQISK